MTYRKKSGILTAVVVILIVALLIGALAAITEGFKNWDPSTWFGRGEPTEEEQPSDAEQAVQENMIGNIAASNGISLLMAPVTVMDAATGAACCRTDGFRFKCGRRRYVFLGAVVVGIGQCFGLCFAVRDQRHFRHGQRQKTVRFAD